MGRGGMVRQLVSRRAGQGLGVRRGRRGTEGLRGCKRARGLGGRPGTLALAQLEHSTLIEWAAGREGSIRFPKVLMWVSTSTPRGGGRLRETAALTRASRPTTQRQQLGRPHTARTALPRKNSRPLEGPRPFTSTWTRAHVHGGCGGWGERGSSGRGPVGRPNPHGGKKWVSPTGGVGEADARARASGVGEGGGRPCSAAGRLWRVGARAEVVGESWVQPAWSALPLTQPGNRKSEGGGCR